MKSTALACIAVGVVVERRKAISAWVDFLWRPVSVFVGNPSAAPWTPLAAGAETTLFFAGEAVIELHRTETTNYRDNLASGTPALWVALQPVASERPYGILAVTADPAEGEALTERARSMSRQRSTRWEQRSGWGRSPRRKSMRRWTGWARRSR